MGDKVEWLGREPDAGRAKVLRRAAWAATVVVLFLVAAMRKVDFELPEGVSFSFLPPLYSGFNVLVAVMLVAAVAFIKRGNVAAHRRAIRVALTLSVLFLLGYVAYHVTTPPTRYGGEGAMRGVYFFLLVTHIILAAASFPFILFAYISGATNHFAQHRRLVRWVFPMWLYVAVTGPLCYLMLRPYYG